jgi:hypothetical protein
VEVGFPAKLDHFDKKYHEFFFFRRFRIGYIIYIEMVKNFSEANSSAFS